MAGRDAWDDGTEWTEDDQAEFETLTQELSAELELRRWDYQHGRLTLAELEFAHAAIITRFAALRDYVLGKRDFGARERGWD